MEFTRSMPPAGPVLRGFAGNGFRVDNEVHANGVMLTPERAWPWDAPAAASALTFAMLEPLLADMPAPEFLLLGTGARLERPAPAVAAAIEARGVGLEVMDSRAAARAWVVLRQEGRAVIAALMPLG